VYGQEAARPITARLFSLRASASTRGIYWLLDWAGLLRSGIEHMLNKIVLYRRSNELADQFTDVDVLKLCLKR
jgi:hypothetical protein